MEVLPELIRAGVASLKIEGRLKSPEYVAAATRLYRETQCRALLRDVDLTAGDIAERLQAEGLQVDRKAVELEEPIKALGVYKVPIRLHADVKPEIRVWVVKE